MSNREDARRDCPYCGGALLVSFNFDAETIDVAHLGIECGPFKVAHPLLVAVEVRRLLLVCMRASRYGTELA